MTERDAHLTAVGTVQTHRHIKEERSPTTGDKRQFHTDAICHRRRKLVNLI